ncbi:hypothetical protein EN873_17780 [bacterium M00.F.Ca.ET.230.01.1.1]|nr:hypothetical protein EN873_17780 [bacterium M00.F.Ca.ET.230.01.1.1]
MKRLGLFALGLLLVTPASTEEYDKFAFLKYDTDFSEASRACGPQLPLPNTIVTSGGLVTGFTYVGLKPYGDPLITRYVATPDNAGWLKIQYDVGGIPFAAIPKGEDWILELIKRDKADSFYSAAIVDCLFTAYFRLLETKRDADRLALNDRLNNSDSELPSRIADSQVVRDLLRRIDLLEKKVESLEKEKAR